MKHFSAVERGLDVRASLGLWMRRGKALARYVLSETQILWLRLRRGSWLGESAEEVLSLGVGGATRSTPGEGTRLKVSCFSHTFSNLEGAPNVLFQAIDGLAARGKVLPLVAAPVDGGARTELERHGIRCELLDVPPTANPRAAWRTLAEYERSVRRVCDHLERARPDVVLVVVLNNFLFVDAASRLGIPAVWSIHESFDRWEMIRNIPPFLFPACERALMRAHCVVFASQAAKAFYKRYDRRGDFVVIRNGLRLDRIDRLRSELSRDEARFSLGVPSARKMILAVGTICENKSQLTLVRALGRLATTRDEFQAFLVGAREGEPYLDEVRLAIQRAGLTDRVTVVPATPDVHTYYRAADIFTLTSRVETYPLVVLEAMAHGLPIVSTECGGVTEQVSFTENALAFEFSDDGRLASLLRSLMDDDDRRIRLGEASRRVLGRLQSYDEMIQRYQEVLLSAARADSSCPGAGESGVAEAR